MDWTTIMLLVLMGGVMYFLLIRPQQKRAKEQQSHMATLEPGTRVMLVSGILATIKYLGDKQAVVEIAPGVEMTVDKRAITTQAVNDEFEYADGDVADDDVAPAALTDDVAAPVVAADDAVEPGATVVPAADEPAADETPQAWDTPRTTRN